MIALLNDCVKCFVSSTNALTVVPSNGSILYDFSIETTDSSLTRFQLEKQLLRKYNRKLRPTSVKSYKTLVKMAVHVKRIREVDDVQQTMSVNAVVILSWTDERLSWNATVYNKSSSILVESWTVWQPDLTVFNSAKSQEASLSYGRYPLLLHSNGTLQSTQDFRFSFSCKFDFHHFPVDEQKCQAVMSAWMYDATEIDWDWSDFALAKSGVDASFLSYNSGQTTAGWKLLNVTHRRVYWSPNGYVTESPKMDNLKNMWTAMILDFHIKRSRPYFYLVDTLPNVLFALLNLFAFWTEDNTHAIALSLVSLFGQAFFSWGILKQLPPAAGRTPKIAVSNALNFIISGFILLLHITFENERVVSMQNKAFTPLISLAKKSALFSWKGVRLNRPGDGYVSLLQSTRAGETVDTQTSENAVPLDQAFVMRRAIFFLILTIYILFFISYLII
ncbi:Neuronal acetylcholine receptor subunit alpha-6 [Trichinella nelsoni]|uniref:Neuronal acetylcholine receptor subunit alpha-6 n=1 Tax=Trichinella nelsoni TaxID=6336 RepID=A0A0V0S335_9BILA|nr:Neuronal acetylcholine receptor subunit alpha-6 [Trichinella nelsoni]